MPHETKLKVVYHEDHEVVVTEMRGQPNICKDCRFAGWLTEKEFQDHKLPITCLHFSGGADPRDGDRVILGQVTSLWQHEQKEEDYRDTYPRCMSRNKDGACEYFLAAKPRSRWQRIKDHFDVADTVRRRMRE